MRLKRIAFLILSLSLAFGSLAVRAEVSQATLDYLSASVQDQWVTQALAASGAVEFDLAYLDDYQGAHANDFAKTILAAVAANGNPYDFNGQNLVEGLLDYHSNSQLGATNLLNDDIWGIMALVSAGEPINHQAVRDAKDYLVSYQNDDGGWAFSTEGASDTNDTASAVMALLEAGLSGESAEIISALAYLEEAQNDDGGWGFYENSESDSGSTAWVVAVLNKLNINPDSWQVQDNSPIGYLESLSLLNGSYKWVAGDDNGSLLMTAYVAVALSGSFYPVAYFEPEEEQELSTFRLRIEGPDGTICSALVEAATALDIVENGAGVCGYDYHIEETGFGPYLDVISGVGAQGDEGWLYWVNWASPAAGAANYRLEEGDQVLWSFGRWGLQPMRLGLNQGQVEVDEEVVATVEYFNGTGWLAVNDAWIRVGADNYQTDENGQASLSFDQIGVYEIYAEKDNFIRTPREALTVGSGVQQSVGLSVTVDNDQGVRNNETLSFVVDVDNLDFGTLTPGQSASRPVRVSNNGQVMVYLEGIVSGDGLFENNLRLNQVSWEDYHSSIASGGFSEVLVGLQIPQDYAAGGQKRADLIFWGSGQ